jgi:hypothetical protein
VDNCFRDQAVTNARQLADLLSSADVRVVSRTLEAMHIMGETDALPWIQDGRGTPEGAPFSDWFG